MTKFGIKMIDRLYNNYGIILNAEKFMILQLAISSLLNLLMHHYWEVRKKL